jgi:hypothetical protein
MRYVKHSGLVYAYPQIEDSRFLKNAETHLKNYMASYSKRP